MGPILFGSNGNTQTHTHIHKNTQTQTHRRAAIANFARKIETVEIGFL